MRINVTMGILTPTAGILRADLLDSGEKLVERYGEPFEIKQSSFSQKRFYKSGDYIIEAWVTPKGIRDDLYPDRCIFQSNTRVDGKALGSSEIAEVLKRDERQGQWQYTGNNTWRLLNLGEAYYNSFLRELTQKLKLRPSQERIIFPRLPGD
jgi:hypothetical protein